MSLIGFGDYLGAVPGRVAIPKIDEQVVTTNTTLTVADVSKTFVNRGAVSSVTLTLPDAFLARNHQFSFTKVVGQDMIIAPLGTDTIADTIPGGILKNIIPTETYAKINIESVQTSATTAEWIIRGGFGTWETQSV